MKAAFKEEDVAPNTNTARAVIAPFSNHCPLVVRKVAVSHSQCRLYHEGSHSVLRHELIINLSIKDVQISLTKKEKKKKLKHFKMLKCNECLKKRERQQTMVLQNKPEE